MLLRYYTKNTRYIPIKINKYIYIYIYTKIHTRKNKTIYWYTKIHIQKIKTTLLIHENTYTTIIAANTRIHDTQNFNTRVKLYSPSPPPIYKN